MKNTKIKNMKVEDTMMGREKMYSLTNAQKQIFEMSSYSGKNTASISIVLWMEEEYDERVLQETVDELIQRNDAFRIKIVNDNGIIKQYKESIHPYVVKTVIFDAKSEYERWIKDISAQGLDIQGELYQIFGCCVEGRFGVYIKMHHIICDGWSMSIVCKELDKIYHAYMQGEVMKYASGSYFECIAKEEDYLSSKKSEKDKEYWKEIFNRRTSLVTLSNRMALSELAERTEHYIETEIVEQIRKYCVQNKCSIYEFFATILGIYLGKISGEKNFYIGTTFAERSKSKDIIGMFVHSVPLVLEVNGTNFGDNVGMVKKAIFYAFKHQKYNYTCMASDLGAKNLYDIKLNYQIVSKRGKEYYKRADWIFQQAQNESLVINLMDEADGTIKVAYDYRICQYKKEEIGILHQHMQKMIEDILVGKEEISYISEKEESIVKKIFNNTKKNYPLEKTVIDVFEEQVEKTPERTAVICGEIKLSYSQLNERINILAHELVKKGIKAGDFVGIIAERSVEMMVGIYAILKTGGAYIPIDPSYPNSRIQYILADAKPKVILTYKTKLQTEITAIDLEKFIWSGNVKNPEIKRNIEDTAYCIFTSGTTGKPKGVMIAHRNLMNYIFYALSSYFDSENKVVPLFTNYGFDLTVTTIFGGWLSGATLDVLGIDNEENISKVFQNKEYTFAKMTPAHLHIAAAENKNVDCKIKHLVVGGEELDVVTADIILQKYGSEMKIHNEYGPTEATVGCCDYIYNPNQVISSNVLIGKPIANTQIYILKNMELCGICVPGELCVAGEGVAKGYLNRSELTEEKFIKNPFGEGRLYRTGDLARWLPDGNLEYMGRIDEQVKIRGFRIELGEIETAIRELSEVHDCVVCVKKDPQGEKILCAYLVSQEGELDISSIRGYLQGKLPGYMVPSLLMQIRTIPMTANGKVDKKSLPEITMENSRKYIMPQSENEKLVSEIFGEVLGVEHVGKKDNFFELGGHSLRATKLVNLIEARTGCRISVREIFSLSTVEEIAKAVENCKKEIYYKIPRAEEKKYYMMSSPQKRIYLSSQMDATGVAYNMPFAIKIIGEINVERMKQAMQYVVDRHEILRTKFIEVKGEPVQKILESVEADFVYSQEDCEEESLFQNFIQPFEFAKGSLIRMKLIERRSEYLLLIDMHHIVGDGMSLINFMKEWADYYNGKLQDSEVKQYKDYSEWMKTLDVSKQRAYWISEYSDNIPILDFPLDFKRPKKRSYSGALVEKELSNVLYQKIKSLAEKTKTTEYMIFLSTAMILLSVYSRQEDIVIGSPISGRVHGDMNNMLGVFVNTLAMRGKPIKDKRYDVFLEEVKETCIKAYENQGYPFEELVEEVNAERDMSRNPLYDVMLVLQNNDSEEIKLSGCSRSEIVHLPTKVSKCDFTFNIYPERETYKIELEYCTDLFEKNSIVRILSQYINLLQQLTENEQILLGDIELITQDERNRIINEFNHTFVPFSRQKTIIELLEEQVEKTPNQIAIEYREKEITYREFNGKVNSLAVKLREKGVKPGDYVVIIAERSIEMVVGIYGIMKAGGAYVPIDPAYPESRINFMIQDCSPKLILTYQAVIKSDIPKMDLEEMSDETVEHNLPHINRVTDTAYCIYTSGTTGKPKGVMVTHTGVSNLKTYFEEVYKVQVKDRVLQFAKIVFDASVWEMNMALLNGATLVIPLEKTIYDVDSFAEWFEEHKISIATLPPNYFLQIGEIKPRLLITAGSESNLNVILKAENTKYINAYGPTETTICATDWKYQKGINTKIAIGKPISNTQIYVMHEQQLCGIGIPGELCVSGAGVAMGYLNRPELTKEKFVQNPFGEGKMYRTGDLVRWLPDGNLEYLGRIDEQVKIRGFRIELEEIDSVLREQAEVCDCAVVVKKDESGEKIICAYIVANERLNLGGVKNYLSERLPQYMVPARISQIERIPMTENGKVDRGKLPDIVAKSVEEYLAPITENERIVSQIFGSILNLKEVGRTDDFFELGGHSLRATKLLNHIEEKTGCRMDMKTLFENSTVEKIANLIDINSQSVQYQAIPYALEREFYPMSSAQKRIYLLCQMDETGVAYNIPVALRIIGALDVNAIKRAMQNVVDRHEILRTEFMMLEGEPVQRIWKHVEVDFVYLEEDRKEEELIDEFVRPFAFQSPSLLRVEVIKRKTDYLMLTDMHHIIGDGMSVNNFMREWMAYYNDVLPQYEVRQYKDYSEWMRKKNLSKAQSYWMNEFSDEIPALNIPLDFKRPSNQSYKGGIVKKRLCPKIEHEINDLAENMGVTQYMIFLSAMMVLLAKYSRQEDIVVGTPISGRIHKDTENMLGMFVNTLVMRGRPTGEKTYEEFLNEIKEMCLKAYENQEYPFEELVEAVKIERDMSRNPMFDVMLVLQNNERENFKLHEAEVQMLRAETKTAKCDLTFNIYWKGEECQVELEYCTELFQRESVERMLEHYMVVLQQLIENKMMLLKDVLVIVKNEEEKILSDFNNTKVDFQDTTTMIDLFEAQVEKNSNNTAVVFKNERISYRELNGKINYLARMLREHGIVPGDYVAIMAERSIEMIVGIYGIIKSGGAYVPIDPNYPSERVRYIIEDCHPKMLLTYHASTDTGVPVIELEDCLSWDGEENLVHVNKKEDIVYCIYTSGTTGDPKGVMNKHISLVNRINWMQSMYPIYETDVILQKTTFSFDVSVWELVWWGFVGAKVVMLEQGAEKNPEEICNVVETEQVTVLHFVPSMLNSFLAYVKTTKNRVKTLSSLKRVFSSGEALNKETVEAFNNLFYVTNGTCLTNLYGPTEACIDVTYYECSPCKERYKIPIGKPISNIQIYILDEEKLCGIGVPGELCIAGMGVAKGYLNKESLTKEKFVDNPYGKGKIYRTGDLTCWRSDGNIDYLGRIDNQVKIRGLRIELGEIENAIRKLDNISDCAVIDKVDESGDKIICGYLVSDKEINVVDIKNMLKSMLPVYMIPARMVQMNEIPVTSNGKLNRRMLPDIKINSSKKYVKASNEKEAKLYAICAQVLGISQFGAEDNFVDLGGDSIKALKIVALMKEAGYEVSTKEVLIKLLQNI